MTSLCSYDLISLFMSVFPKLSVMPPSPEFMGIGKDWGWGGVGRKMDKGGGGGVVKENEAANWASNALFF